MNPSRVIYPQAFHHCSYQSLLSCTQPLSEEYQTTIFINNIKFELTGTRNHSPESWWDRLVDSIVDMVIGSTVRQCRSLPRLPASLIQSVITENEKWRNKLNYALFIYYYWANYIRRTSLPPCISYSVNFNRISNLRW